MIVYARDIDYLTSGSLQCQDGAVICGIFASPAFNVTAGVFVVDNTNMILLRTTVMWQGGGGDSRTGVSMVSENDTIAARMTMLRISHWKPFRPHGA